MRYAQFFCMLASMFIGGCTPPVAIEQSDNSALMNPPISLNLTCAEFLPLIRSHDRTVGATILWLDGYHSGRAGLPRACYGLGVV
jgi:hypothetical protein